MLQNKPLQLKVTDKGGLILPVCVLQLLIVFAALSSPQPVLLTVLAVLIVGAGWVVYILEKPKTNNIELILVIFPDGRVRLESDQQARVEGMLVGQQWCTRWLAVLRVAHDDTTRKLVIRSADQPGTGDFRRLNMWLRQDFLGNTGAGHGLDR